ncbi:hypothetical protein F4678DRAFT_455749 [Xylaria arbuscula]|nr:hypothetical protein F4678DRAFT_455749 [Xylaria arbuscula]
MRISAVIAVATALVTQAAADFNVVGPFALRITSKRANSGIDGYAWACHAGAATEGLCYAAGSGAVSGYVYEFYHNYTFNDEVVYPGFISYVFSYQGSDGNLVKVPSFMQLYPNWVSNVNLALLPPGVDGGTPVSLDSDTGFFYIGFQYDDTHSNSTPPAPAVPTNISNFHLCFQWTGGYWYRSLAWVSGVEGTAPQNPSCEPVNLGIESLAPS